MPDTGPSQCSLSAFRFSSLHLPQPLHAGLAKGGGILVKKTRKVSVVPGVSRTSPPLGHWAQEAPSSGLKVVLLHPGSPAHPLRGSVAPTAQGLVQCSQPGPRSAQSAQVSAQLLPCCGPLTTPGGGPTTGTCPRSQPGSPASTWVMDAWSERTGKKEGKREKRREGKGREGKIREGKKKTSS